MHYYIAKDQISHTLSVKHTATKIDAVCVCLITYSLNENVQSVQGLVTTMHYLQCNIEHSMEMEQHYVCEHKLWLCIKNAQVFHLEK